MELDSFEKVYYPLKARRAKQVLLAENFRGLGLGFLAFPNCDFEIFSAAYSGELELTSPVNFDLPDGCFYSGFLVIPINPSGQLTFRKAIGSRILSSYFEDTTWIRRAR
ncbi:hypothetical protein CIHG_07777 [Coccidioides immitis H538.4]|uniref:Uncharacterized protein n=3 Tax=Coccidioides immitis TaxID=5501 RepID=A0A0J8QW11_COCIT|nr:hypothetical protein CIRG_05602 [Coccidioides immitis RMSCC 2394]KMU76646.1 hypothetical protein CISG_05789 [Coccidioides immitis RMSCC 3703]KMU89744.1 hypothetical protein CIHG_07777 [Coccidioides immitis H538.4]